MQTSSGSPPKYVQSHAQGQAQAQSLHRHSTSFQSSLYNSESNMGSPKLMNSDLSTPTSVEEYGAAAALSNAKADAHTITNATDPAPLDPLATHRNSTASLVFSPSFIHDADDGSVVLNTIASRRSSRSRNNKRNSALDTHRASIPFHASKHSQIIPAAHNGGRRSASFSGEDSSDASGLDATVSAGMRHLSINSLPATTNTSSHGTAHRGALVSHIRQRKSYSIPADTSLSPTEASGKLRRRRKQQQQQQKQQRGLLHDAANAAGSPKQSATANRERSKMRSALTSKKAMKRRRKAHLIDDDRVLIGNKVSEGHVNFIIAYNMLTGIRVSVSRCSGIMKPLTDQDFRFTKKLAFDYHGNELTPSSQYAFKFKDYCPEVFRELRALFGLDPADYLVSLTSKYILSELNSPGKSGSFFYYSRDYKYIIKTIHRAEHIHLRKHLREYYTHVKQNPDTLLCQFYGLHRVKMPISFQNKIKHRKIYFIVMNNLFPPHLDIHRTYDLKGSTWGRRTAVDQRAMDEPGSTYRPVLKDLNWLESNERILFGPVKKKKFLEQLRKDISLLSRLNIMDYSLLVGIHDLNKSTGFVSDAEEEDAADEMLEPSLHDENIIEPGEQPPVDAGDPLEQPVDEPVQEEAQLNNDTIEEIDPLDDAPLVATKKKHVTKGYEVNRVVSHFFKDYEGGITSSDTHDNDGRYIYYIGIIDCMTNYSIVKKLETFWRSLSHDRKVVSAIPPRDYGQRLYSFVGDSVDTKDFEPYKDDPTQKNFKDHA